MSVDPTRIEIEKSVYQDPLVQRVIGRTTHGNHRIDCPFISEVAENLWQGGCESGLVLPDFIKFVVSLYPWEAYTINHELGAPPLIVQQFDAVDESAEGVMDIANQVNEWRKIGPVLVHCQAGLNRSGRVVATALVLEGMDPDDAITHMREIRSPAVLCNPTFERWVRSLSPS